MDTQSHPVPPSPPSSGETIPCVHHWILGDVVQGVIPGCCKRCGARRGFPGVPAEAARFDDFRELTQSSTFFERSRRSD